MNGPHYFIACADTLLVEGNTKDVVES